VRPPPERIETERLLLRPLEVADTPQFVEMLETSREHYATFIPFYLDGDWSERVRGYRAAFHANEHWVYAAFEGGRMAGGGMLFPRIGPNALELGYQLRGDATGRGLATEIATALLDIAFGVCGAERVEAHIAPANEPSIAVAERIGLERTGRYDGGELIFSRDRSSSEPSVTSASESDSSSGG
jgi:RimJ/RimL family protein N-acetyltransferase